MNKIVVDTKKYNISLKEDLFIEVICDTLINIKSINNNSRLLIYTNNNIDINIEISNSNLVINNLGINAQINYNVTLQNNSNLKVIDSILSKIDSINNINIFHKGINCNTSFNTNGINLSNKKLYFNINGIISKESINSYLDENSKIINVKNGDSKIVPNLIIDNKDVIANHSAFIGTFSKDDLYYLMSRGISLELCKNLLIKSILLSKMDIDKDLFIKEIYLYLSKG